MTTDENILALDRLFDASVLQLTLISVTYSDFKVFCPSVESVLSDLFDIIMVPRGELLISWKFVQSTNAPPSGFTTGGIHGPHKGGWTFL